MAPEKTHDFEPDIVAVNGISSVPKILDIVCRTTGMGFSAVARVTEDRWVTCSSLDHLKFGLKPGDELNLETTICHEIRQNRKLVVFDNADADPVYAKHHTPAIYGLKSYISVPIVLSDGSFFGTLCAIDPKPARINTPEIIGMFELYAELIAQHLEGIERLRESQEQLLKAQKNAELREQFIAVLGHDLRNPLGAIMSGVTLLEKTPLNERGASLVAMMHKCTIRMTELIENVLDLARGRMGAGIALNIQPEIRLEPVLNQVINELRIRWPDRVIAVEYDMEAPVDCDPGRVAQLLSNLLGNALAYGDPDQPVRIATLSTDSRFELSVANGGAPIPQAALAKLFQPFVRGSGNTEPQGLGLGLYIASEIARAHGGDLTVRSDARETEFRLRMVKPRV